MFLYYQIKSLEKRDRASPSQEIQENSNGQAQSASLESIAVEHQLVQAETVASVDAPQYDEITENKPCIGETSIDAVVEVRNDQTPQPLQDETASANPQYGEIETQQPLISQAPVETVVAQTTLEVNGTNGAKSPEQIQPLEHQPQYDSRDAATNSEPAPKNEPAIDMSVDTVSRSYAPVSKQHLKAKSNPIGKKALKKKLKNRAYVSKWYRRPQNFDGSQLRFRGIQDLEGCMIGGVLHTPHQENSDEFVYMGNSMYVANVAFDFAHSEELGHLVRATAYLTEEGKTALRTYVKAMVRKEFDETWRGKKMSKKLKKSRLNERVQLRNAYDHVIDGVEVHMNLGGKIEIFSPYKSVAHVLTKKAKTAKAKKILGQNTRYTGYKLWIRETNNDFNQHVGKVMYNLSTVVQTILH